MAEKKEQEKLNKDRNKILAVVGVLVVGAVILAFLSFNRTTDKTVADESESQVGNAPIAIDSGLTAREWTWVNTQMNDGAQTLPSAEGAFTLTFQDNGTVLATTDCNGGNGSYTVGEDNSISFGPMATSMMFCEGSTETEFFQQLSNIGSYTIQDDQLWLMIKFDSGTMIFE